MWSAPANSGYHADFWSTADVRVRVSIDGCLRTDEYRDDRRGMSIGPTPFHRHETNVAYNLLDYSSWTCDSSGWDQGEGLHLLLYQENWRV
jgi:hypothetical protein